MQTMRIQTYFCKQTRPLSHMPRGGLSMQVLPRWPEKEKVVVVMGVTGTGKSKLSIDLATRFQAEIINSDKIQVYQGLDIVTNKITPEERCNVPHHLLGTLDPTAELTADNFREMASAAMESIIGKGKLPMIVGGSNSFIEALVDDKNREFRSKYECCFLWVDVSMPVLHSFLSDRVNRMIENGMVDEARPFFSPKGDYSEGIRKAIGVPEFHDYFGADNRDQENQIIREKLLQQAIDLIKTNNCKLACRQVEKIYRLRNMKGWKLHRLDATEVFRKRGEEAEEAWENLVAGPSTMIVDRFLYSFGRIFRHSEATATTIREALPPMMMRTAAPVAAAASH